MNSSLPVLLVRLGISLRSSSARGNGKPVPCPRGQSGNPGRREERNSLPIASILPRRAAGFQHPPCRGRSHRKSFSVAATRRFTPCAVTSAVTCAVTRGVIPSPPTAVRQLLFSGRSQPVLLKSALRLVGDGQFQPTGVNQGLYDTIAKLGAVLSARSVHHRDERLLLMAEPQKFNLFQVHPFSPDLAPRASGHTASD